MFPLSEILTTADTSYRQYLAKKTGFVLAARSREQLLHFWLHVTRSLEDGNKKLRFTETESVALMTLLLAFGYLPPSATTPEHQALEEKFIWIFKHPQGGIFLPLEVIKSLMRLKHKTFEPYLFARLYNLKLKEQRNLVSLIGGDIQAQLSLTFEANPLDMALVLYIWFAGQHLSGEAALPERGRLLSGPWSSRQLVFADPEKEIDLLPWHPVPLWKYLDEHFSHQTAEIEELRHHIQVSRKGFYRPLGLLKNSKGGFCRMFRLGFLIPIPGRTWENGTNVDDIEVVSPREIYMRY